MTWFKIGRDRVLAIRGARGRAPSRAVPRELKFVFERASMVFLCAAQCVEFLA
jgi:hypothetical protein